MISKLPNGKFRARVFRMGIQVTSRVFPLRREAVAWEADQKYKLKTGQWTDPRAGDLKVDELIADFLTTRKGSRNRNSLAIIERNLRHVPPLVRRLPVGEVTVGLLESMYLDALNEPLEPSTVVWVRDDLERAFEWAKQNRLISENVVARSAVPDGDFSRPTTSEVVASLKSWRDTIADSAAESSPATSPVAPRIDIDMSDNKNNQPPGPVVPMEQLLTFEEVCELTQTKAGTMYHLLCEGRGPESLKIGRNLRFRPAMVREWLADSMVARA